MDHEPDLVRAQRTFERRRSPSVVVGVLATFVLIALIKPWSFGQDGSDTSRPTTQAPFPSGSVRAIGATPSAVPSAAATPAIVDPNAMACLTDDAEQIVLFERWSGTEVRSWIAAKDSIVPGPLDARLVPVPVFSSHVIGLGVCAPRSPTGAQDPAARLLDIQAIVETDAGTQAIDLGEPVLITLEPAGREAALLYGAPASALPGASPAPSSLVLLSPAPSAPRPVGQSLAPSATPSPTDAPATWPTGPYAIGFRFTSDDPNLVRWLRIDLIRGAGVPG